MSKAFGREASQSLANTVKTTMLDDLIPMRAKLQDTADNHGHAMTNAEYLAVIAQIDNYTRYIEFLERPMTRDQVQAAGGFSDEVMRGY